MSRFEADLKIMPFYIDTAKMYMGLASGALGLTMAFRERIVGAAPGESVGGCMVASWFALLLAIGGSAFYQYLAVKYLDISSGATDKGPFPVLADNPGYVYGFMLVSFYAGAVLLVLAAWFNLP